MDNTKLSNPLIMAFVASAVCTFYSLLYNTMSFDGFLYPISLIVFSPIVSVFFSLYLMRQRSTKNLILVSSLIVLLYEVAIFLVDKEHSFIWNIMAVPVVVAIVSMAIYIELRPLCYNKVLRFFDFSVILYLFTLISLTHDTYSLDKTYLPLLSIAFAFLAVIAKRSRLSKIPVIVLLGSFIFFLISKASSFSFYVKEGVNAIIRFCSFLMNSFMNFIQMLLSLLPKFPHAKGGNLIPVVNDNAYKVSDVVSSPIDERILSIGVVAISVLVALALAIHFLGSRRIGGKKKHGRKDLVKEQHPKFSEALGMFFSSIRKRIRTNRYLRRNKNNAIGLFFIIKKRMRNTEFEMKVGETPNAFLNRVEGCFSSDDVKKGISVIRDQFEMCVYSNNAIELSDLDFASDLRRELLRIRLSQRIKRIRQRIFTLRRQTANGV